MKKRVKQDNPSFLLFLSGIQHYNSKISGVKNKQSYPVATQENKLYTTMMSLK